MIKNKIFRRLALLVSVIMLFTSTVQTTFCFIVTKTDSLINTFVPFDSVVNSLLISKTVEHPYGEEYVIPDDISFDFEVDLGLIYANTIVKTTVGNITADENGTILVSVKPGKIFGIEGIDTGTKVTVTEVQKDGSGFAVKDGAVTKEVTVTEDGNVTVDFINVYTPTSVQPVNVTVGGTKILEGREWQSGDSFSFKLEQSTDSDTWVTLGTKTVTYDAEKTDFNKFDFSEVVQDLTLDKVGTYTFRITEILGNLEYVDYDKTVNTFTIKVTDVDMDGKLEIGDVTGTQNASVTKNGGDFNISVTFNNTFVPHEIPEPEDTYVTVTVNKTVKNTGDYSIGPEGFEFVLENILTGEKAAIDSDENGTAIFTLPFTAEDIGKTYTYKLYETNEGVKGITYDTDVYDITVDISLSDDNKLIADMTVNGSEVDVLTAEFENIYHAVDPAAPPTGDNGSFWIIMMIVSGTALAVLVFIDRKYSIGARH